MAASTEQSVVDLFYQNDSTKTISNLIEDLRLVQNGRFTTQQVEDIIKSDFPDVSDWSF